MENGSLIGNVPMKGLGDISNLQEQPASLRSNNTAPRKGLADITNLQQQQQQPGALRSKDLIDKLQQENMLLLKVLADRNKVIEMSGIELKKLRVNLEKFQQQNKILTQTNSQMLAELNSGKDRLKSLRHELGCKNAVLKALKSEVETNKFDKAGEYVRKYDGDDKHCDMNCGKEVESLNEEDGESKPCNTNRRRQSKPLCLSNTKPVQSKEKADSKRVCSRRQSARSKAQESETNEDVFEVDGKKVLSSCDYTVNESGSSNVKPVQAKEKVANKRVCLRRQSARFKAEEPETSEDVLELDDIGDLVSSSCDDKLHESGPASSGSPAKSEQDAGSMTSGNEAQELRRVSVGRPLRRAAEKVQSYKEMKLNVKLRREE